MTPLLRIDTYALAFAENTEWQTQWCAARREGPQWQFGEAAGELLQPKRTPDENNEYLENQDTASDRDLAYLQLQQLLPPGVSDLNLTVCAGLEQPRISSLLGILDALNCRTRAVFPAALVAARQLEAGTYGLIELGRNRSWMSVVEVHTDQARMQSMREYAGSGFSQLFTRWVEMAAEAFAAQHRFDVHRNFAKKRGTLFAQMRQAFAHDNDRLSLTLDGRNVTLDMEEFRTSLPAPTCDTAGLTLRLLPPLSQTLPLPEKWLQPSCCPEPDAGAYIAMGHNLADALPDDDGAHICTAFSF